MRNLLILAGLGQLGLALGSLWLPKILHWQKDTLKLRPLTRQVFWTYAAYIWVTNVCFGVASVFAPDWLVDGSPLARVVTGYITAYWGVRLLIQLTYFERSQLPAGALFKAAEGALVVLFVFLTAVYGFATVS